MLATRLVIKVQQQRNKASPNLEMGQAINSAIACGIMNTSPVLSPVTSLRMQVWLAMTQGSRKEKMWATS